MNWPGDRDGPKGTAPPAGSPTGDLDLDEGSLFTEINGGEEVCRSFFGVTDLDDLTLRGDSSKPEPSGFLLLFSPLDLSGDFILWLVTP